MITESCIGNVHFRLGTSRTLFGHPPHAWVKGSIRHRARRCRGSLPLERYPTTEELILKEVQEIKWLLVGDDA